MAVNEIHSREKTEKRVNEYQNESWICIWNFEPDKTFVNKKKRNRRRRKKRETIYI